MPRHPRPLKNILQYSGKAASLMVRVARHAALLQEVKKAGDPRIAEGILAAIKNERQLIIYTASPAWASRLRFTARELQRRLNSQGLDFNKVSIRVVPAADGTKPNRTAGRHLSRENSQLLLETAESLSDPALSAALKRLSTHLR